MRINRYIALATGVSRRAADRLIAQKEITINKRQAVVGAEVSSGDDVALNGQQLSLPQKTVTVMLNKPAGFVCSRRSQGSQTIYELLPKRFHDLKTVGRLDKDSSGLILLTNDGRLTQELTHPGYGKDKIYEVTLNKPLAEKDRQAVERGVVLSDGLSKLKLGTKDYKLWAVTMSEGRNRQIRRTFLALGYEVKKLHRTHFGPYHLDGLKSGAIKEIVVK